MIITMHDVYNNIISVENLLSAWQEFLRGKRKRNNVATFSLELSKNIYSLNQDLLYKKYEHGSYSAFNISDPKPRNIHKASVRDRLLHHAIYRVLYSYFDKRFIYDSYSCRNFKGTHMAMKRFRRFSDEFSKRCRNCWVLKCDIRKFFASIDHEILVSILRKHIEDEDVIWLLEKVIESFNSGTKGKGLPLGNLTSQLLVNVYMNEFDQFIKHELKVKYYIRYADDFVILSQNKQELINLLQYIVVNLNQTLKLSLHPSKVSIKTLSSGIDFLGWVHFPDHKILRTSTKKRMFKKIKDTQNNSETVQSYLGLLKYGNTHNLLNSLNDLTNV